MDNYNKFLETASDEEIHDVKEIQNRINNGRVWSFDGAAGRQAIDLLGSGVCELGEKGHKDFWGNYVPSRHEVKPGTMGAPLSTRLA